MAKTSRRLARADWLRTGLDALAETGPSALKAEPLARRLGTTKGSFYWHFEDVPAFHAALLAQWEDEATARTDTALAAEDGAVARLRRLAQIIAERDAAFPVEPAVRAWAKDSDAARAAIARLDDHRLTQIQALLAEIGIANPEMARIIYAAGIGMEELGKDTTGTNAAAMGSLVDLVLALR